MTTIYNEFRTLTSEPLILQAINIIDGGKLPPCEAKELAFAIWQSILPAPEKGKRHLRTSFWGQCIDRCIWKGLYGYKAEQHADFLRRERVARERKGQTAPLVMCVTPTIVPAPPARIY